MATSKSRKYRGRGNKARLIHPKLRNRLNHEKSIINHGIRQAELANKAAQQS